MHRFHPTKPDPAQCPASRGVVRCCARAVGLGVVAAALSGADVAAAAQGFSIVPEQTFSGVLAGRPLALCYSVDAPSDFQGWLGWSLSVDGRTLARGEVALAAEGKRPRRATIDLTIPDVREGLAIEAAFSVDLFETKRNEILAAHRRRLWIFAEDPFAQRAEWLERLRIALFDPKGDTAALFRRANVPFRQVATVAALETVGEGLLVIGQGTSFADHRSLPATMIRAAARGVPVLCLAPSAGTLSPLEPPSEAGGLPVPGRVVWRREDAIGAIDKRLDTGGWPPDGRAVAGTIAFGAEGGRVVGRVGRDEDGWPWMELHYPDNGATLLFCGFGIVDHWDAGPSPRYLLFGMLEMLEPKTETEAPGEK